MTPAIPGNATSVLERSSKTLGHSLRGEGGPPPFGGGSPTLRNGLPLSIVVPAIYLLRNRPHKNEAAWPAFSG